MARSKLSEAERSEIADFARAKTAAKGYVATSDFSELIDLKIEKGEIDTSQHSWYVYRMKQCLSLEGWHQEATHGRNPSLFYPPDMSPTGPRNTELRRLYNRIHPMAKTD